MNKDLRNMFIAIGLSVLTSTVELIAYPMCAWVSLYFGFGYIVMTFPHVKSWLFIIPTIGVIITVYIITKTLDGFYKITAIIFSLLLIVLIGYLIYQIPNWEFFDPYNISLIPTP